MFRQKVEISSLFTDELFTAKVFCFDDAFMDLACVHVTLI